MRVIDAHTGNDVQVGDLLWLGHGDAMHQVMKIEPGVLEARMLVADPHGVQRWVPFQVRWTHPKFFLQHVAFVPS